MDAISPSNFVMCTKEFAQANGFQPENIYGLPDSGRFTAIGRTYQMEPFTDANVLYLMGGDTGLLELISPARFSDFSLLSLATEGSAQVKFRFQFSDGSSVLFTRTIDDWFNTTVPPTFSGYGRVKRKDGPILPGDYEAAPANPRFRILDFSLPCKKILRSIHVINSAPQGSMSNRAFILAAAGMEKNGTASVQITSNDTIACEGDMLSFNAKAGPGESNPVFYWYVNGVKVLDSAIVFSSDSLRNGDQVFCTMKSSLPCASPDSVQSEVFVIQLQPKLRASVKLQIPDSLVCEGDSLWVKAETENCGQAPLFTWQLNGSFFSTGASEIRVPGYSSGDLISCTVTASGNCLAEKNISAGPVSINTQPEITITAEIPLAVLLEDLPFRIKSKPAGVVWRGPGIASSTTFSPPDAGAGRHVLKGFLRGNYCSDTLFQEIIVLNLEPNNLILGSGEKEINKYWRIEKPGLAFSEKAYVEIYNRWGLLVKIFENYQNNWEPSELGPGCYFYKVFYTIPGRTETILKTGYFTYLP